MNVRQTIPVLAVAVVVMMMFCQNKNPVSQVSLAIIPSGNYISYSYTYFANDDTLFVLLPKIVMVNDTLISNVSINVFPINILPDSLRIRIYKIDSLGADKKISAELFETYARASEGAGIEGKWKLEGQWFSTSGQITRADSLRLSTHFDNSRAWMSFSQIKLTINCWSDKILHFYARYMKMYRSEIEQYNVTIDSLDQDSFRLAGNVTLDTVAVSQDSTGMVTFLVKPSDTSYSYKPNPYLYSMVSTAYNIEHNAYRENPDWITFFLKRNPLSDTLAKGTAKKPALFFPY